MEKHTSHFLNIEIMSPCLEPTRSLDASESAHEFFFIEKNKTEVKIIIREKSNGGKCQVCSIFLGNAAY